MKKRFFAMTAIVLSLTAYAEPVTKVPGLDRVMTVSEFSAQPALRDRILKFCANDPGRYRQDPNCINAVQSGRITSAGSGKFPRIDSSLPF